MKGLITTREIMVSITVRYRFVNGRRVNCDPFLMWIRKRISVTPYMA